MNVFSETMATSPAVPDLALAVTQCLDTPVLDHLGPRFGLSPGHLAILTREVSAALLACVLCRCAIVQDDAARCAAGGDASRADSGSDGSPQARDAAATPVTPDPARMQLLVDAVLAPGVPAAPALREALSGSTAQMKALEAAGHTFFLQVCGIDTSVPSDIVAAHVGVPAQATHAWTGLTAAVLQHVLGQCVRTPVSGTPAQAMPAASAAPALACVLLAQWPALSDGLPQPLLQALGCGDSTGFADLLQAASAYWLDARESRTAQDAQRAYAPTQADRRRTARAVVIALLVAVPLTAALSSLLTRAQGDPVVLMRMIRSACMPSSPQAAAATGALLAAGTSSPGASVPRSASRAAATAPAALPGATASGTVHGSVASPASAAFSTDVPPLPASGVPRP